MLLCNWTLPSCHAYRGGRKAWHCRDQGQVYLTRYTPPLKIHKICSSLKYYLHVYMDTNKSIDLLLNIAVFNTLPMHTGKSLHSPSTHWILWEPFMRNLGLQAYSTTSLHILHCVFLSLSHWEVEGGGGAHDFTFPSVEILHKLWLHCLSYNWKIQLMQKFILLNDLLFIL